MIKAQALPSFSPQASSAIADDVVAGKQMRPLSASPIRHNVTRDWQAILASLLPGIVFLSVILAATRAILSHKPWMVFFEDDFFYYLKVAQNLAHGAGSTFNGIAPTNGYHPLWLVLLTAFSFVSTRGPVIFGFVVFCACVATMAVFYLSRNLLLQMDVGALLPSAIAAYLAIYSLHLFYTGMEVILAIPMVFLFLVLAFRRSFWQRGFWPASVLGLVVSLMVLSRLDLILLAGFVACSAMVIPDIRRTITRAQIAGIALGLLPLAAYFLFNHFVFGTWFPVSGMAKQVKFNYAPTLKPWQTFYGVNPNNWINMAPVHIAILTLPFVWKRMNAAQRWLFPPILLFPFFYVAILCCLSDWQIWIWYLYPLRAALCVSCIVFSLLPFTRRIMQTTAFSVVVFLIVLCELASSKWWTDVQPPIYAAAVDIQTFARTHPGVYAMGDRSGMVGYLLPYPLIQTEGLMMDREFLEHIRRQDPLIPTLRSYHVRYFVGTAWDPYKRCFHAEEPFQAGKSSAHMSGDFCHPAVASSQHEFYRTRIFDLDLEPAANK